MYMEIMAVYYDIHTKHTNAFYSQNVVVYEVITNLKTVDVVA
jgi:hypothetical protein